MSAASEIARAAPAAADAPLRLGRHRGLLIAIAVFAICFSWSIGSARGRSRYFEISFLSSGGATLAIAAMGETLVILSGGFDLSAGAVISLVNVVLASQHAGRPVLDPALVPGRRRRSAAAAGAFNGFFVAFLRLQPIVVTLSTMFILQGLTLLVLDKPGAARSRTVSRAS